LREVFFQQIKTKEVIKMKKLITICAVVALVLALSTTAKAECVTIQDGTLFTSIDSQVMVLGYDEWGYNYQAHMFNGDYCDYRRGELICPTYDDDLELWVDVGEVDLMMKWNDAWLSNKDCDDDDLLDRHYGYISYKGSGAWLTNHMSGKVEVSGKLRKWTYFIKIVAVPLNANEVEGIWYDANGIKIGPSIWGPFAIIQELYNDPASGAHGILYKSPAGPGFGIYGPE